MLIKFTTLIATVAAFRIDSVNFNCVGRADGVNYGNPKECSKFFTCSNGIAKNFDCAEDAEGKLEFNNLTRTCDFKANVNCDDDSKKAGFENCRGLNDGVKYPAIDEHQYFTCTGDDVTIGSCGSDVFDVFQRKCVGTNATDKTTWDDLATTGKEVDSHQAFYANRFGRNVSFVGSSVHEKFYALRAEDLKSLDEGNAPDRLVATTPEPTTPEPVPFDCGSVSAQDCMDKPKCMLSVGECYCSNKSEDDDYCLTDRPDNSCAGWSVCDSGIFDCESYDKMGEQTCLSDNRCTWDKDDYCYCYNASEPFDSYVDCEEERHSDWVKMDCESIAVADCMSHANCVVDVGDCECSFEDEYNEYCTLPRPDNQCEGRIDCDSGKFHCESFDYTDEATCHTSSKCQWRSSERYCYCYGSNNFQNCEADRPGSV